MRSKHSTQSPSSARVPAPPSAPAPARRALLGASVAVAGTALLGACSSGSGTGSGMDHASMGHGSAAAPPRTPGGYVDPAGPEVRAAEAARKATGPVTTVRLTATATPLDLGAGLTVRSWAYGDRLPGQEVRVTAGGTLALTLANHLPQATSLHWHGLALRNDMDGVPGLTQRDIAPGAAFDYRFAVPHPGTYWFHPHSGVQQDRGLYAPLIVEDPKEPLAYDKEWVVVLDDWLDGVDGSTPDAVLAELRKGMGTGTGTGRGTSTGGGGHAGHDMGAMSAPPATPGAPAGPSRMLMGGEGSPVLGKDTGDVAHPHYLVNGRVPQDPPSFAARPGDRIRLRIVNAGGDTAFRIALGGHELTVTHTDGFPVEHTKTGSLLIGMGERYDVLVTAGDGVFPLTALAEGKGAAASALALLRTGTGAAPTAATRPAELAGPPLTADRLRAAEPAALAAREPDRTLRIKLTGGMAAYDWAFDGRPYAPDQRHPVTAGDRVRLEFENSTTMWHPLHLHGHTFALGGRPGGARKDTAAILPGGTLTADFDADNPGLWMLHCHNVYHSEAGMMTVLGYQR
ncbi:multicopper oxidase family protein [Streptomyces sp. G-G2]|uniref:multicopper oxidase family protein n=1 Tax=Streptomyces sp. G-G2 TaxID=3046201 RepID=UPI0024B8926C|nr:multicopper oxidase family protein [Streptomyces sp. G-G2]MDJ0382990.1 multicopper oxidase family protein [Streptomyces sp. G-G2]